MEKSQRYYPHFLLTLDVFRGPSVVRARPTSVQRTRRASICHSVPLGAAVACTRRTSTHNVHQLAFIYVPTGAEWGCVLTYLHFPKVSRRISGGDAERGRLGAPPAPFRGNIFILICL